jgi:signal transduction histidine kinase
MFVIRHLACLVIVSGILAHAGAAAEPPVVVLRDQDQEPINLLPYVEYLRDASGALDLDDVLAEPTASRFLPSPWRDPPIFGFTPDTIWVRCRLASQSPTRTTWYTVVDRTRLDWVAFHLVADGRPLRSLELGNAIPDAPRDVDARPFVFEVPLEPGQTADLYMAFQSEASLWLPLSLVGAKPFWTKYLRTEQWNLTFFGYMLALSIIAAFMAVAARDKGYFIYTLATLALALFFFTYMQYAAFYRLPLARYWGRHGCMLLAGLAATLFLLYTRYFLNLPRQAPRLDWVLKTVVAAGFLLSAGTQMCPYAVMAPIITMMSQIFLIIGFVISLVYVVRGHRTAVMYMAAWAVFLISMILRSAVSFGWAPTYWHADVIGQASSMLGYTLFLLALAVRIRDLDRDKLAAQSQLLAVQTIATHELERKVEERTARLNQAKTEAETARQAMSRFLINVVHDIRAPVNAVFALAQSLWLESEKLRLPEAYCQFLNRVRGSGEALSQMLANLFDLSQLELGYTPVRRQSFLLADWVGELRPILDLMADQRGVRLTWEFPDPGPAVTTDRVRLGQILMNLAQNAIKFTPSGKSVSICLEAADGFLTLTVQDEGPGIPADKQANLWNRDAQIGDTGRGQGLGLGLFIVKSNVNLLGGTIAFAPAPAGGASFTFRMPL